MRKEQRAFVVSIVACLTAACQQTTLTASYNENDLSWARATGKGSINGQAYLKCGNGIVHTAQFKPVILLPSSAYIDEYVGKFRGNFDANMNVSNLDRRFLTFAKMKTTDAGGGFTFDGLPDGKYYVISEVEQRIPAIIAGYNSRDRNIVAQPVVAGGKATEAVFGSPPC